MDLQAEWKNCVDPVQLASEKSADQLFIIGYIQVQFGEC